MDYEDETERNKSDMDCIIKTEVHEWISICCQPLILINKKHPLLNSFEWIHAIMSVMESM